MQWCVQGHKLSQWWADTCMIPAGAIGSQWRGFYSTSNVIIDVGLVLKKDFTGKQEYRIRWFWQLETSTNVVYTGYVLTIVSSIGQLALYSTTYCRIVYYSGQVYDNDKGCERGNLVSRVARWLGDWSESIEDQCDNMNAIYLTKNQVSCKDEAHQRRVPLCSRDSWWVWHRITKYSHEGESSWYAYQDCSGSKVCTLSWVALYPSSCLSSVELVWMNYRWLDP